MKKVFTLLLCMAAAAGSHSHAQLPKWVIHPTNDTLFVKVDGSLIEGRSNGKSLIWNTDGKSLYSTGNYILPYKDGVATVKLKGQPVLAGFIDGNGRFIALPNVGVAYANPYFENGLLLCYDNGKLVYYKNDGTKAPFPDVVKAYPFHKGFAPYFTYEQLDKKKDPHYGYFRADGKPVGYMVSENGNYKPVDPKDINFASAIGAKGQGVAVIKNKVYWFNATSETFEPFLWGEHESVKKRHLNIEGDYEEYFRNLPKDTVVIMAKYGKKQFAKLKFDRELRPVLFSFDGEEMTFVEETPLAYTYKSDVSDYAENGSFGLSFKSRNVLPPQFEKVGIKYGNKAFVNLDGKWGVIEIIPDVGYGLELNEGNDIGFRHQKFDTQMRLDLPPQISAKEVRIDIPVETGCEIEKTSRMSMDTESGNYVTYKCKLTIPPSLPDTLTTVTYNPVNISYEGVRLFEVPMTVKAWHLKYYNVDPIESETSISNGVASFTLNINAQRMVGEGDYPLDMKIEADSTMTVESEKISETRYKCIVSNLQEGNNNLNIYVLEKGCPPSIFPFEIYYSKPVPKKKKKENVVIRKKEKSVKKEKTVEKSEPRLEL